MHKPIITFSALALLYAGAAAAAPNDPVDQPASQDPYAGAAGQQQSADQPFPGSEPQSAGQQSAATHPSQPQLASAEDLVGKTVTTRSGERVGTVKYVTIDLSKASVSHLIVDTSNGGIAGSASAGTQQPGSTPGQSAGSTPGQSAGTAGQSADTSGQSAGTQGQPASPAGQGTAPTGEGPLVAGRTASAGQLLILPWTVVEVNEQTRQLETSANAQQLASGPRLEVEALNQLTQPSLLSYVVDYWAPVSDMAAFESQREQNPDQRQSDAEYSQGTSPESTAPYSRNPAPDPSATETPPSDRAGSDVRRQGATGYTGQPSETDPSSAHTASDPVTAQAPPAGEQAPDQTAHPQQPSSASQAGGQQAFVLIGQGVVTDVVPPMFQLSEQLRGATVKDRAGQTVGEIRRIFIDQQSGRAAYAVVENRSGGEPAPVPVAALDWAGQSGTTTLAGDASNLQANPTLTENPEQVRREDLAQLYQRFGTTPYWEVDGTSPSARAPLDHQ